MTEAALYSAGLAPAPGGYPPVKPRWLSSATTVAVVLAHVAVAVLLMAAKIEEISPENGLNVELMPEGDTVESEEAAATEFSEAQPQEIEQTDLALPPPQLMTPDAVQLPQQQEVEEKKRTEKKDASASSQAQEASERRRLGVQGGRATGMSRSSYMGLLAAAIHRHVPSVSSLGPGTATCHFSVTGGGSIAGVSCSGSSGSHMSLLRSAIYATRPPGAPPGGGFSTSQSAKFH
ncbi:MAG TPA: hypothetical protein VEH76_14830 [Methylocystis sp.]|nr:hypothetical protein [Methylocystis sp.]